MSAARRPAGGPVRVLIETIDTVREINRWEITDLDGLIPDWNELTPSDRHDRIFELIGDGAEFCKNLEADTLERDILTVEVDGGR